MKLKDATSEDLERLKDKIERKLRPKIGRKSAVLISRQTIRGINFFRKCNGRHRKMNLDVALKKRFDIGELEDCLFGYWFGSYERGLDELGLTREKAGRMCLEPSRKVGRRMKFRVWKKAANSSWRTAAKFFGRN